MKTPKEILDSEFATQNLTGMVRDGVINAMNQYAEEKLRDEQHQNTLLAQKCSDLADEFVELKWKVGQILTEKFLEYNNGKFHLPVEINPAVHEVTEFIAERLKQERNKAIDECINYVKTLKNSANPNDYGQAYIYTTYNGVITELESLKDKSHE